MTKGEKITLVLLLLVSNAHQSAEELSILMNDPDQQQVKWLAFLAFLLLGVIFVSLTGRSE